MYYFLAAAGLYTIGWLLFGYFRRNNAPGSILAFHAIDSKLDLSITRNTLNGFESIIQFLSTNGYCGTTLSGQRDDTDIALTFDDGWACFYDNAWPLLQKYNFAATIFVVTDYIGHTSNWDYKKKMHLDWQQLRELVDHGIEIGSHGATHCDLRGLSNDKLEYEIAGSKKLLEDKLGCAIKYFSYPFGRYDSRVMGAVREAGYHKAFALSIGFGDFAIARHGVYLYDSPYSIYLKLIKHSPWEQDKDYINNSLSGGTIAFRKLFPVKRG